MLLRWLVFIVVMAWAIFIQQVLKYYFPLTGLGYLLSSGFIYIFSFILALGHFYVYRKVKVIWLRVVFTTFCLCMISLLSLNLHPFERPIQQMQTAYHLYKNPDKVVYEDLFRQNNNEQSPYVTAALVKYKDSLPDKAVQINYATYPTDYGRPPAPILKSFYISCYDSIWSSDNAFVALENDGYTEDLPFQDTFRQDTLTFRISQSMERMNIDLIQPERDSLEYWVDFNLFSKYTSARKGFNAWYYGFLLENWSY